MATTTSAHLDIFPGEALFCQPGAVSQDIHCRDVYNNEEPEAIQTPMDEL